MACCKLYHWRQERMAESSSRFIHLRHSSKSLRVLPLPEHVASLVQPHTHAVARVRTHQWKPSGLNQNGAKIHVIPTTHTDHVSSQ